jgi:ATP-dependent Clp protease ATP-binding subunit ClpB
VSQLVEKPPDVGYEEGGQLTEPCGAAFSVVLFDEIEKAHADVFNTRCGSRRQPSHRCKGRTVDFRNTVVIMTSNIGSECLLKA